VVIVDSKCNDEDKVVFRDGGQERAIRGIIVREDDWFIFLQRRDGIKRIAKSTITKIEERGSAGE